MQSIAGPIIVSTVLALVTWAILHRQAPGRRAVAAAAAMFVLVWVISFGLEARRRGANTRIATIEPQKNGQEIGLAQLESVRPVALRSDGYVSSRACQNCHPDNHASWHASYHRTMTQVARPSAVMGDFDDTTISFDERTYRLQRRNDVCWVEMDDPDFEVGEVPRIERPIVMTTGSHHMQVFWYPDGGGSRVVGQMPLIFLKEEARWIPRAAAFLKPPGDSYSAETGRWNKTCSRCHTTYPRARPDGDGAWDTLVAEFGIACEACHGPGQQHVQMHEDASRSKSVQPTQAFDDRIVDPGKLSHRRASEICGQCHSMATPKNNERELTNGSGFRPGQDLDATHFVVRDDEATRGYYKQFMNPEEVNEFMRMSFWADGMIRVSGREFNGLSDSACYQQGELSCLSCHSLHKTDDDPRALVEWADDQLGLGMNGDDACLQCHEKNRYDAKHTHHQPHSSGSRCYNCHMPHTSYGLLKAIRSHQISSPDVSADLSAGRPNACNLCHLDQTLAWTSEHMQQWYGSTEPDLDEDQRTIAASLLWLLKGDAGQRALAAWTMSWPPALEASGDQWAPFLAFLLDDPYDAVRFIARRSLRRQPGFDRFEFDFVGPANERKLAIDRALEIWNGRSPAGRKNGRHLLMDAESGLQRDELKRLLEQRDDRSVNLVE